MYQVHPTLALLTIFFITDYCGGTGGDNRHMSRINRNIYKGCSNYTAGLENVLSGIRVSKDAANESHEQRSSRTSFKYRSGKLRSITR